MSYEEAKVAKVQNIFARLDNLLTKFLLHFISCILPSIDQFDWLFQKSTQNTTPQLYDEMNQLVRVYASNFLTADTILKAGAYLKLMHLISLPMKILELVLTHGSVCLTLKSSTTAPFSTL